MKKIFIFFLTILLSYYLTIFLSSPVLAQDAPPPENWVDSDYAGGITGALESGEMNAPAYASHMQTNFMADGVRKILGPVPGVTITADAYKNNPRLVAQMQGQSAVASIGNYMAMMYANPPADLALWVRDTGQTLGFFPKIANAQGIGFSGLAPLLPLWKAFRNIAYLLLAIVMIVVGFMIMLRKKIDPKTVVTIQNALPNIVITLLLITFSYALVGILIDIMYLTLLLIVAILVSASNGALGADTATKYLNGGFWRVLAVVFSGGIRSLDDVVAFISPGASFLSGAGVLGVGAGIGALIGGGTAALVGGGVAAPLVIFLVAVLLLLAGIRLAFVLISSYIQIIIALLSSPIQILFGAIPGSQAFGSWIKNLVSNLAVFPITAGLLLIATILSKIEKDPMNALGQQGQALWSPPLVSGTGHGVSGLIALGILLSIPTIVNGIKESFKAKPAIQAGGLGQFAGMFGTVGQMGFQYVMGKRQLDAQLKGMEKWRQSPANETASASKTQ